MRKDKKWLKDKIKDEEDDLKYVYDNYVPYEKVLISDDVYYLIDQLDEPEVKQLDKKIKELDSYNDELIRDNNQLRNELDNQEVLSQGWIEEHKYNHYIGRPFVYVDDLQNLLVPKQDKPIIPKFVADFVEKWKYKGLTMHEWFAFGNNDVDDDVNKWLYNNLNEKNRRREYLLIDAIRNGYEVEEEKRYIIKFAPSIYGTPVYGSIGMQNGKKIMQSVYSTQKEGVIPNQYTQKEIEEVGIEYMAFAKEVTE